MAVIIWLNPYIIWPVLKLAKVQKLPTFREFTKSQVALSNKATKFKNCLPYFPP